MDKKTQFRIIPKENQPKSEEWEKLLAAEKKCFAEYARRINTIGPVLTICNIDFSSAYECWHYDLKRFVSQFRAALLEEIYNAIPLIELRRDSEFNNFIV